MNQPHALVNQRYATLTLASALREMFGMQLYKNNARALLSRILSILNLHWLQHARSVRGVYELYIIVIIYPTPRFVSIYLIFSQLNIDSPSKFFVFFFFFSFLFFSFFFFITVKSSSVTKRSESQENAFKKTKIPLHFFRKIIGANHSFTLIENNFKFLRTEEWVVLKLHTWNSPTPDFAFILLKGNILKRIWRFHQKL